LCRLEKINTATRPQLHALCDRHFTFWISALKQEEAAPMCAFDFSLEKASIMYISKFNFSSRHFSLSVLAKAVYEMKFLWKKALPFSPKSCQNGKNSMADNLTITDPNGKVRIYCGSSWL
jgi:hypothetical protein